MGIWFPGYNTGSGAAWWLPRVCRMLRMLSNPASSSSLLGEPTSPSASGRTGQTRIVAQSPVCIVCPAHSLLAARFAGGAHRDEAAFRQHTRQERQGCLGISCFGSRESRQCFSPGSKASMLPLLPPPPSSVCSAGAPIVIQSIAESYSDLHGRWRSPAKRETSCTYRSEVSTAW